MKNVDLQCVKCGVHIKIDYAEYTFERIAIEILSDGKITRQQARRFKQKALKTQDLEQLSAQSLLINPKLTELTEHVKKQKNQQQALKSAVAIVLWIAGAVAAAPAVVLSADELWDKWQREELFESHTKNSQSHEANEQNESSKGLNADELVADDWKHSTEI